MKIMAISLSLILYSLLSACAVHTREGSIVVDPDRHHSPYHEHRQGDFCPPGQAKKRALLSLPSPLQLKPSR